MSTGHIVCALALLAAHPLDRVVLLDVENVYAVQELFEGWTGELGLKLLLPQHLNLAGVLAHGDDALVDVLDALLLGKGAELVVEVYQQGLPVDLIRGLQRLGLVVENAPNLTLGALFLPRVGTRPRLFGLDPAGGLHQSCLAGKFLRGQVLLLVLAPLRIHCQELEDALGLLHSAGEGTAARTAANQVLV